jgi:hypothetical protein
VTCRKGCFCPNCAAVESALVRVKESAAARAYPTTGQVVCALCEGPGHVARFCPKTVVGIWRQA